MSEWIEVKDFNDLDIDGEDLNILYEQDNFGAKYITIPMAFIVKILEEYKAKK